MTTEFLTGYALRVTPLLPAGSGGRPLILRTNPAAL